MHTGRDARLHRRSRVRMSSHGKAGGVGRVHDHPHGLLVELRLPGQRPRCDVAAGHHHLDDIGPALGPSANRGREVRRRRLRPGQEVAVPPGRGDRRTAGQDPRKADISLGAVANLHDGVVAVAEVLDRRHPAGQGPARVRYRLPTLRVQTLRDALHAVWRAAPRQVLVTVDQTRKQGRAGTVVDDLSAAGRRLHRTHLDNPSAVIDEDLAAWAKRLAIKDRARTEDAHPPW